MFVLQDSLGVIARTFVSLSLSPLVWESEPRCNDELDALVLGSLTHPLLAPQGGFDSLGSPLRRDVRVVWHRKVKGRHEEELGRLEAFSFQFWVVFGTRK